MKYHCRSLLKVALPLLVLVLSTIPAKATSVVMLTDEELILSSRVIVTGTVRSVFSAWNDEQNAIYTYVEVRPDRFLKGDLGTKRIVLKQLGGTVGTKGMRINGQPQFVRGQQVLLYLSTAPDGTLRTAHFFMGAFSIVKDAATATEWATRDVDAATVESLPRPDGQVVNNRAPLQDYLHKINDTLQRGTVNLQRAEGEESEPPIVAVPPEWRHKKQKAGDVSAQFVLMGDGVRWFEPDVGQPVNFYINPSSSPIAGGAPNEISRAMNAWSAQSGANITIRSAGQTGSCGMLADGTSTISFGDCMGQLQPPFGCAGVLAITQTSWNPSETRTVGGRTYSRIVEADLVFNRGMDCFLGVSANLAEVVCHELGHAMGLAHSTDASAIMWSVAHGRGRDATLGDDDRAGILSLYPSTGGSGGGGGGTGGGGGGGGVPVPLAIMTTSLPTATAGRFYSQALTATGGASPYRWTLIGGLPIGLSLTPGGLIQGTTTRTGSYSVFVQVTDQMSNVDSQRVALEVGADTPSVYPEISRVKVKKSKKITIFGVNFRQDAQIILNGLLLAPSWFEKDGDTTIVFVKHKVGPPGTNVIYVQNPDTRSQGYVF